MHNDRLHIYCDGSCPSPYKVGGWAFIILDTEYKSGSGWVDIATNQTMELCAALEALRKVKKLGLRDRPIDLISDSMYVVQGMMDWREKWIATDYAGKSNVAWWRLLHGHFYKCKDLRLRWVKGHGSSKWNNHVDRLAGDAQKRGRTEHALTGDQYG